MYFKLRVMLIILSLAEIQLKGRAFLRLYEIQRQRQNWCRHHNFGFSLELADSWFDVYHNDPRIPDKYFRRQLQMRRATFCFLLDVFRLDTSED